jgi:hypothetical protein
VATVDALTAMRHYKWNEMGADGGNIVCEATDAEILKMYYPYWCEQMRKVGRENLISEEACLEDFIVVNWAWEVDG